MTRKPTFTKLPPLTPQAELDREEIEAGIWRDEFYEDVYGEFSDYGRDDPLPRTFRWIGVLTLVAAAALAWWWFF